MKKKGVNSRKTAKKKTSLCPLVLDIIALIFFIPVFISTINYNLAFVSGLIISPICALMALGLSITNLGMKNQTILGKSLNTITLVISAIATIFLIITIFQAELF